MNGQVKVQGLLAPANIYRDSRGIPSIFAESRRDISFAIGFLHAQERFFQMDLMRRAAAGELAELFGKAALSFDKERRCHRLRSVANRAWKRLSDREKKLLRAYTEGVNCGLKQLKARPFEYFLLGVAPLPWKEEDSILTGLNLFFALQDPKGKFDLFRGVMQKELPQEVFRFFAENGSAWDAPLDGKTLDLIPVPASQHFSYLEGHTIQEHTCFRETPVQMGGSNQWAVTGSRTKDGKALLACDMHLELSVPNVWYRGSIYYAADNGCPIEVHGATLPGTPLMIVGSNRHIAWGFTNSYIDTSDVVFSSNFATKRVTEWIHVKGCASIPFEVEYTPWGPVLEETYSNQTAALLWVAHDPSCVNMQLTDMETACSVREALGRSKKVKIPLLNFLVADKDGHIGWTLIGAMPDRKEFDGKTPVDAAKDFQGWAGFKDPSLYPRIYDPQEGMIVTANNRVLDGDLFGKSGFGNGIRAFQIREKLRKHVFLDEKSMLSIQLDDEAFFFNRWNTLLQDLLASNLDQSPRFAELLALLREWDGRSTKNSAAYYWVRTFRNTVANHVLRRLLQPCFEACKQFDLVTLDFEEPLWMIVSQQPDYLASCAYRNWEDELVAYITEILSNVSSEKPLSDKTWGKKNTLRINHPLSRVIPFSDKLLNMPHTEISGDIWVPRVSGPRLGASQRLVVAPGREEDAIFQMPAGQCGHPLSPHYSDLHGCWVEGEPNPLLPGKPLAHLQLKP